MPVVGEVTIRGVTYASVKVAAFALGVTPSSVWRARQVGSLESVGLGRNGPAPMVVRVRGMIYPSVKAAAADLGVTGQAVYKAITTGREDVLGTGPMPVGRGGGSAGGRFCDRAAKARADKRQVLDEVGVLNAAKT